MRAIKEIRQRIEDLQNELKGIESKPLYSADPDFLNESDSAKFDKLYEEAGEIEKIIETLEWVLGK